jgi:hypothetical protein
MEVSMRRVLDALALLMVVIPLLSFAPAPKQAPGPTAGAGCSEQLARMNGWPYLHQVVLDRRNIPYGEVAAWSCSGDSQAAIAEFQQRLTAMQVEVDRRP